MEIRKVLGRRDGVKMVIVPKKSKIVVGDYVKISKLNNSMEDENGKERKD